MEVISRSPPIFQEIENTVDNNDIIAQSGEKNIVEKEVVQIDFDDIKEKVDFWNSAIVRYVMGANPLIHVMEGFVHRIWKNIKVDKVAMIHKGVFIVRFSSMDNRDKILLGHYFFDNEPLILKSWVADMDFMKEDLRSVPVWIQLKLNIKYWGEKALFKIVEQIGKPIQRDEATKNRHKVQFARVLVEVYLSEKLIDQVVFVNEYGDKIEVEVKYEWKPVTCEKDFRPEDVGGTESVSKGITVDLDGFQRALRLIKVRVSQTQETSTDNHFSAARRRVIVVKEMTREGGTLPTLMDKIISWNVRGINSPRKQKDVLRSIQKHSILLVGLLKTKVKACHLGNLYQNVFNSWCFTFNIGYHPGGRVVLAWNHGVFSVSIIHSTDQFIHCYVQPISGRTSFFCTFIYAYNESARRESLWADLRNVKTKELWLIMGDLNCVRHVHERIGAPVRSGEMEAINRCMIECGLDDVRSSGYYLTWNNKQQGNVRVFSKLDRIMENEAWLNEGKKPFKYYTMWRLSIEFNARVSRCWNTHIVGSKTYVVCKKMKLIKKKMQDLNRTGFNDIQAAEVKAYQDMLAAQAKMHSNPSNQRQIINAVKEYKLKHKAYLEFISQVLLFYTSFVYVLRFIIIDVA
ncbi:uncharacterized protein LOC125491972 [Beta vulgaris subsp. vulgaris]|uniref:uncharacterized protein LOC125491972 n=1 Tax=Beta vulgaris subsp. vulgaris TaxID=3555 RepID=UPI00053FE274|nr:uncharacterized protein LOC125491972 [Beta vulgaris subsp. vulgaris]